MKKKQKANKSKQKPGPGLTTQPPAELTDEQLQQVVGGSGLPSNAIPPVGNEVLVSFEEGNPDRPYVVGSIWNSKPGS